jgi:hypothetical protein
MTSTNLCLGGQIELRSAAVAYAPMLEMHKDHRESQTSEEKLQAQPQRKYFGHNKPLPDSTVVAMPAPLVVKKERFSFLKRNSTVAAH